MTNKTPCKKLGNDATAEQINDAHKVELAARKLIYNHNVDAYGDRSFIFANQSKNHPNYGETPAEQERRMNGVEGVRD